VERDRHEARRSRARLVAGRLGLCALGLAVGLVLAEAAYRWHVWGPAALLPANMRSTHTIGESGLLRASGPVGYELKPDLDTRYLLHPFRTNRHGLRDDDAALEKPAGTFRIAVVGDSFTMGHGVAAGDVYHAVLERRLREEPGGMRFEALNFGVAGYGLHDYAAVIEEKVLRFDPDLILIGLTRNDQTPATGRKPYVPKPVDDPFTRLTLLDALRVRAVHASARRAAAEGAEAWGEHERLPAKRVAQLRSRYVNALFERIAGLTRPAGVPVLMVHLVVGAGDRTGPAQRFEKAAARHGFLYLDTTPAFDPDDPRDFHVRAGDAHPNAAANALYADAIHAYLLASGLILERTVRPGER
jgi:lysophospholipase L1-like esterase